MKKSKIEWTDATWNPVTGCDHVSNGCQFCYAERMAARLKAMGNRRYANGFNLTVHEDVFDLPLKWKQPQIIFVNSMSDLFHERLSFDVIARIFDVMNRAEWHTFQILTKRPIQLLKYAERLNWTENIWMGVTVESGRYVHRIDALREVPAAVRFISFEPLIERVPEGSCSLQDIHWAIIGGESGPGARPMDAEWAREIRRMCQRDGAAFFFKQWGGVNKSATGRVLDGRTWDDMPSAVKVRSD
ncbi:MAG TPA: phage Gp37/Gp68 family protein [Spirochaetia bacterium]|nr:phage Gp37/Gp68 family protein [Spirochaetia bacterium]